MSAKEKRTAISPTREDNYPEWYQQIIRHADLAETSPVRGCMVIKPWGYALWENIQRELDRRFRATGHRNAYFPLFIPMSFLEKEAQHVEGFAKECAVVTHSRLEAGPDGKLIPASPLEEPLIVRPTSETIIGDVFSRWVQSYRDLPLLINQWANVVRWEMRTRLFLRTAEFLWQEGHTAHATKAEAMEETLRMLDVYADFAESWMAMPVIKGEKTEGERFPGAEATYSIEAMMQDRKALQAGTSHFLGQKFSRASGIRFLNENGEETLAWTTSWGVSTRLVGGLIMSHSDDDGLVCPPRLAPAHVVILPVVHKAADPAKVFEWCDRLADELSAVRYGEEWLRVEQDKRDLRGGDKYWSWMKKGVPIILEVGPRDIEANSVFMTRRDKGAGARQSYPRDAFVHEVISQLEEMQNALLGRARSMREDNTRRITDIDEFRQFFTPRNADNPEIHGGFVETWWAGSAEDEMSLAKELKVSIRCMPMESSGEKGRCILTGKADGKKVIFAKAY